MVTDEYWRSGEFISAQVYSYIQLAKLELQLGRLNYALAWWKLAFIASSQVEERAISEDEYLSFDAYLSQCILNTPIDRLNSIRRLPDLLDKYQLFSSRCMLLYSLGHEDIVKKEYEIELDKEHMNYLKMVRDSDLGAPVPELTDFDNRYTHLKSSVMGCHVKVSFPFRSPLVELAETILSGLEALLSTGIIDQFIVYESRLEIEITADDDEDIAISHDIDESGGVLKAYVQCSSFTPDRLNVSGQKTIQDWQLSFIVEVFSRLGRLTDQEKTLRSMIGEDRALERSISFGACFVGLQNIMGNDAVSEIKALIKNEELHEYNMIRKEAWDWNDPKVLAVSDSVPDLKPGKGEPPTALVDKERLSHRDLKVQDLIKIRLWDRTVWLGTGFSLYPDSEIELTLLFRDEAAAGTIFNDLVREVGNEDKANRIRISIIKNIDRKNPSHYRVCISENFDPGSHRTVQMIARLNTMTPLTSKNLDGFLSAFKEVGRYKLNAAVIKDNEVTLIKSDQEKSIVKYDLNVIEAWKIGPNDLEVMAISRDDDPLIPDGVANPPILESMRRRFNT